MIFNSLIALVSATVLGSATSFVAKPLAIHAHKMLAPDVVFNGSDLPENQGWTPLGPGSSPAPFSSHGLLFQKTSGSLQAWSRNDFTFDYAAPKQVVTAQIVVKMVKSPIQTMGYAGPNPFYRSGFLFHICDAAGRYISLDIADSGLILTNDIENRTYVRSSPFIPLDTTAQFYRIKVVVRDMVATVSYANMSDPKTVYSDPINWKINVTDPTATGEAHAHEIFFGSTGVFAEEAVIDSFIVNITP